MKATGMLFLWVRNYRFWSHYKKGFQGGKSIFCIQKGITYGWGTSTVGIPGFDPLHVAKYGLAWKKIPATLVPFTLTRLTQSGYWWWFSTVRALGVYVHTGVSDTSYIASVLFTCVRTKKLFLGWLLGWAPVSYWAIFSASQKSLLQLTRPSFLLVPKVANRWHTPSI